MRPPFFILRSQRAFSIPARLAVALFTLLQIVAPTWHICEMGGAGCHDESTQPKKAEVWKPKCGGGHFCPCQIPPGAVYSPTGKLLSAPDNQHSDGTCLARELMGMPGGLPVLFPFDSLIAQRLVFAPSTPLLHSPTLVRQPPARGPPHSRV